MSGKDRHPVSEAATLGIYVISEVSGATGDSVDVRIQKCARPAQFNRMKWKVIRLELASSWEFPRGSAGRSYLIRLPLTDEGCIDTTMLEQQPAHATVRRHWPNQADMVGRLIRTPLGFAIQYENVPAAVNGGPATNGHCDPQLFQFGAEAIRGGDEIVLTEPDGYQGRYRVANFL